MSITRLANVFLEPRSSVGRWVAPDSEKKPKKRKCPVSGDTFMIEKVRELCMMERHLTFGHRRIRALMKIEGIKIAKKTVYKIMKEHGLCRPKIWRRPKRPKRVEKMRPGKPNKGWQIDMTCFQLANLTTLYLVVVIDCYSRKIMGWTLSRRCRTKEWTAAMRMALEAAGFDINRRAKGLTVRSDNGSQPCSREFVEFLNKRWIKGQYTGYDSPDDNAYVERVIRTIKEEEVWINSWEKFNEAHEAIENYIEYYNKQRPHSSLGYETPEKAASETVTLNAA